MTANKMFEKLGLDPIPIPPPIDADIRLPHITREERRQPTTPAATPEDQIAREAVAAIEREEGFDGCALHRLRGAYDGDPEHRIALKAIELFRQTRKEGDK
jgi:hypothetical protein